MLRALSILALFLLPLAAADSIHGSGTGASVPCCTQAGPVGVAGFQESDWQVFWWNATAGARTLDLTWAAQNPLLPPIDYDMRLYAPGAVSPGLAEVFTATPVATSEHHDQFTGGGPEHISYTVPTAGLYAIAIVPHQAQDQTFTLTSSAGDMQFAGDILDVESPPVFVVG